MATQEEQHKTATTTMPHTTQQSEVARLREQITLSYESAFRAMHAPRLAGPHYVVTAHMEHISDIEAELVGLVGANEATRITIEAMKGGGDVAL